MYIKNRQNKFNINSSLTLVLAGGWPKLAAVQKGPSHTLNTQFVLSTISQMSSRISNQLRIFLRHLGCSEYYLLLVRHLYLGNRFFFGICVAKWHLIRSCIKLLHKINVFEFKYDFTQFVCINTILVFT